MRLVEGVAGEGDQDVPEGLDGLVAVAVLPGAGLEDGEVLRQLLGLLLAHDAAEDVGLAERVPGDDLGGLLDLLLVDDEAVGDREHLFERLLQLGVDRGDLLLLVLAQGVVRVRVHAHRARPVQGGHGGDVFEVVGLHQPEQRAHGAAVELEDAEGVAALEQFEGLRVVERQGEQVEVDPLVRLHHLDGVVHDGEVAQAQEVHLQEAERLALRVVPLRDGDAVGVPHPDRGVVDDRLAGHDHAGGVHAHLPDQALDAPGGVDDLLHVGLVLVHRPDLARLAVARVGGVGDAVEVDALAEDVGGHGLGEPVAHGVRVAEDARGVLDGVLGLDLAVGADHGHLVGAVLLRDVPDDLDAPALVEVDVDVGHGDALGVEEALEDQAVRDGVEVGDAHGVRDDRAGRGAPAGAHGDALLLRPHDEVGDDEEVAGEAHRDDRVHLVLDLLHAVLGNPVREPAVHAAHGLLAEPGDLGVALGDVELRHEVLGLEHAGGVDLLGDQEGVAAALLPGVRGVDGVHLVRGLQVVAGAVELEAVRVGEVLAGLDAEQGVVGGRLVRVGVVRVVGDQRRDAELLPDLQEAVADPVLDLDAVVHQLQEVPVLAEDVLVLGGGLQGLVELAEAQSGLELAGGAAGGGDQALGPLGDGLLVHPGPLLEPALGIGVGGEPEEVVESGGVRRPDRLVGVAAGARDVVPLLVRLAPLDLPLVPPGLGGDVRLDADDRRDPGLLGRVEEVVRAVQVAVVGHGDVRHAHLVARVEHVLEPRGTVQQRVLGVDVEVREGRLGHGGRPPGTTRGRLRGTVSESSRAGGSDGAPGG